MSGRIPANHLSWSNFVETLIIIAFCSFAIGLYWRFKFRSRYLILELEEARQLNEMLKSLPSSLSPVERVVDGMVDRQGSRSTRPTPSQGKGGSGAIKTLTGITSEKITLSIDDLLFIETMGNYVKVCHMRDGRVSTDMLRATSKQMEDELRSFPMIVRCHRAFLVNLAQVEQIVAKSGSMQVIIKHSHDSIPVSRSNVTQIKNAIRNV